MIFYSDNEEQFVEFANDIAKQLNTGDCIALFGDLGTGKSTFARAVIKHIAKLKGHNKINVPSPTFTIIQEYELSDILLWHMDLYRIDDINEILELGIIDMFDSAITIIEWPQLIEAILPANTLKIFISHDDRAETARRLDIENNIAHINVKSL